MDRIVIRGGNTLNGKIPISGAKNAALPLMAASLLTEGTLTLSNLPHLVDIMTMSHLLAEHGIAISMNGDAPNDGHSGRVFELTAKKITKLLRDEFPKVKAQIQGDAVRVSGKSRDELQNVIARLKDLDLALVGLR